VTEQKLSEDIPADETMTAEERVESEAEVMEELSLEEQLAEAKEEAAKHMDSFLRAQAELSNARKRFEKQQLQVYTSANADLVTKLLPALDDFGRAIDSVPDSIRADSWFEGIELVHRKLIGILESLNVKVIEAIGQPFDPNYHDALAQEPSDEYESGIVTREMIKGYQIGDKVVRPSLVYVAE
jgi:molecular chaperone GrpE